MLRMRAVIVIDSAKLVIQIFLRKLAGKSRGVRSSTSQMRLVRYLLRAHKVTIQFSGELLSTKFQRAPHVLEASLYTPLVTPEYRGDPSLQSWRPIKFPQYLMPPLKTLRCFSRPNATWAPRICRCIWNPTSGRLVLMEST